MRTHEKLFKGKAHAGLRAAIRRAVAGCTTRAERGAAVRGIDRSGLRASGLYLIEQVAQDYERWESPYVAQFDPAGLARQQRNARRTAAIRATFEQPPAPLSLSFSGNFGFGLDALSRGFCVRRGMWEENTAIKMVETEGKHDLVWVSKAALKSWLFDDAGTWTPTIEQLLATDWEVAK
jgi:hypothetical protein